ncbi:hypothetical protein K466DRAFT_616754, partial [Polyporus arcularius HHB13444]
MTPLLGILVLSFLRDDSHFPAIGARSNRGTPARGSSRWAVTAHWLALLRHGKGILRRPLIVFSSGVQVAPIYVQAATVTCPMAAVSVLHKGGAASHELYHRYAASRRHQPVYTSLLGRRRTVRVPELGMCSEPLPWSLAYRSRTIKRRAANGMSLARRFETRRVELDYTRGKQLRWA